MRAEIHHFHSPDADPLDEFRPASRDDAGALVQMMMNPEGQSGEESFQIVVGTAEYIATLPDKRFTWVVDEWDWEAIRSELILRVAAVEGETWTDVAEQINQWAQWEFDGYRE